MEKDQQNNDPIEGEVLAAPERNKSGQFIKGVSGNPKGRPRGSKNRITLLKLEGEEAFRSRNADKLQTVLDQILEAALEGDRSARKMVWDALMSKAQVAEDKTAGNKQQITVHRMTVNKNQQEIENDEEQTVQSGQELE